MISRRDALITTLFGAGTLGLRSLATGLPVSFLLNPKKALASPTCASTAGDYGAIAINSTTGSGSSSGDIQPVDTLGAFAEAMLAAVGGDPTVVAKAATAANPTYTGKVVTGALA